VGSVLFTTIIVGFGFFGPASFWPFIRRRTAGLGVGLAVAQLVSHSALRRGLLDHQPVGSKQQWLLGGRLVASRSRIPWPSAHVGQHGAFIAGWFGIDDLSNTQITLYAIGIIVLSPWQHRGVKARRLASTTWAWSPSGDHRHGICPGVAKYPHAPSSVLFDTGGTVARRHPAWMGFPCSHDPAAYAISSFDGDRQRAEETRTPPATAAWEPAGQHRRVIVAPSSSTCWFTPFRRRRRS